MAKYYGIIAVRFSETQTHPHYISHVFIIENEDTGRGWPGELYTRSEAVKLLTVAPVYTLIWNYTTGKWDKGAKVSTEIVNGITYLRSRPDDTTRDNLSTLIDYDFFGRI